MFEITSTSLLTASFLGTIWLIGLWRSVQYAIPKTGQSDFPALSRKALFHVASLLAIAGPIHTFSNGFSRFSVQIWVVGFMVLYLIWAFWYMRVYRYSDFLFEVGEFGYSKALQAVGAPRFMAVPNWILTNPVLFFFGLATTLTGIVLSIIYWHPSYLAFSGYGIIYLFFVWVYNLLNIVKIWDTHLEFRNGFTTHRPTHIPLHKITAVKISASDIQKRFGVSTVDITTEQTSLRLIIKKANILQTALATPPYAKAE